jgi:hypothetical protein
MTKNVNYTALTIGLVGFMCYGTMIATSIWYFVK